MSVIKISVIEGRRWSLYISSDGIAVPGTTIKNALSALNRKQVVANGFSCYKEFIRHVNFCVELWHLNHHTKSRTYLNICLEEMGSKDVNWIHLIQDHVRLADHSICGVEPSDSTTRDLVNQSVCGLSLRRHYREIYLSDSSKLRRNVIADIPAEIQTGHLLMFGTSVSCSFDWKIRLVGVQNIYPIKSPPLSMSF